MKNSSFSTLLPKFLICFLAITTIVSCKKSHDTLPQATINFKIYDENHALITGATTIAVYDSEEAYYQDLNNFSTAHALKFVLSVDGEAILADVPSKKQLWIKAYYSDPSMYPSSGFTIELDNREDGFVFPLDLEPYSIVSAKLFLKPANGLLTIQSPENINKLNFKGEKMDTLITSPNSSTITIKLVKGNYSYSSTTFNPCSWAGNVDLAGGENKKFSLEPCSQGYISFYTTAQNDIALPIEVTLGLNNVVGRITKSSSAAPSSCTDAEVATALQPGNYTYFARSISSKCAWSGTLTVTEGGCKMVLLDACN